MKDRNATLRSSLVIRSPKHRVFFSGDTGLTVQQAAIGRRLGSFALVILEVGAFHPAWGDIHLGPANALEALDLLGGGALLPVRRGTISRAMHAWDEPAETLLALAPGRGASLMDAAAGPAGRAAARQACHTLVASGVGARSGARHRAGPSSWQRRCNAPCATPGRRPVHHQRFRAARVRAAGLSKGCP